VPASSDPAATIREILRQGDAGEEDQKGAALARMRRRAPRRAATRQRGKAYLEEDKEVKLASTQGWRRGGLAEGRGASAEGQPRRSDTPRGTLVSGGGAGRCIDSGGASRRRDGGGANQRRVVVHQRRDAPRGTSVRVVAAQGGRHAGEGAGDARMTEGRHGAKRETKKMRPAREGDSAQYGG
jgi:hypothetical protein